MIGIGAKKMPRLASSARHDASEATLKFEATRPSPAVEIYAISFNRLLIMHRQFDLN